MQSLYLGFGAAYPVNTLQDGAPYADPDDLSLLDPQYQETSQTAEFYKVLQALFFVTRKILKRTYLAQVMWVIVQIEIGYIVQRFL